jgi:exosortase
VGELIEAGDSDSPRRFARPAVAALAALAIAVCYAPAIHGMFNQWLTDEDMGHAFFVPIVAGWIVWRERKRWQPLPMTGTWWGFVLLAAGAGLHAAGELGAGLFASSAGFAASIAGVVLCLGGPALFRAWAFPMLLTLFMLPKLAIVYNQVTLPLQLLASRLAAGMLTAAGAAVVREGDILEVAGHRVAVVEACSGIRYFLPLAFTAVVFAYVSDPKPWMRAALLIAAVPLAILANAIRVAVSAAAPASGAGAPHFMMGIGIFVLCLAALILARRMLNAISRCVR